MQGSLLQCLGNGAVNLYGCTWSRGEGNRGGAVVDARAQQQQQWLTLCRSMETQQQQQVGYTAYIH